LCVTQLAKLLLCPGRGAVYCDQFVCVSVCLSASISLELPVTKFCVQVPMAVAQSSSRDIAIRYVLPVLWMTSRLAVVGSMALCSQPGLLILAVSYVRGQCTV